MADWAIESLGNKTVLQHADIPYMDMLARCGRTGMLKTVQDGFHPGSEVANSAILGYDQNEVYEGRGPLEAASIGVSLADDDMAIRCNIICIEGDHIKNHSCGRLETEEADVLVRYLQEHLAADPEIVAKYGDVVHFYTGIQYRHLLVINGGSKYVKCTPPHDVPMKPWQPLLVQPDEEAEQRSGKQTRLSARQTADLLNELIAKSQKLLAEHPFNKQRIAEGKDPANSIWPWAGGYRPHMKPLTETFPQIGSGAVITAVDLIRGIGSLAGLRVIEVPGATGLYDTNYEGKAQAAIDALRTDDFVYLHVEASDEAGHEGDLELKVRTVEYLDSRIVGPIYEAVKDWGRKGTPTENLEPVCIAVLPDHPTPVALRTHTNEPVPFLIYAPGIEPDDVQAFDEPSCSRGGYGTLEKDGFIRAFMNVG